MTVPIPHEQQELAATSEPGNYTRALLGPLRPLRVRKPLVYGKKKNPTEVTSALLLEFYLSVNFKRAFWKDFDLFCNCKDKELPTLK